MSHSRANSSGLCKVVIRHFSFKEQRPESFGPYVAEAAYLSPLNECIGTADLTVEKGKSSLATGLLNSGSPWHQSIFTTFSFLGCFIVQLESKTSFETFFVKEDNCIGLTGYTSHSYHLKYFSFQDCTNALQMHLTGSQILHYCFTIQYNRYCTLLETENKGQSIIGKKYREGLHLTRSQKKENKQTDVDSVRKRGQRMSKKDEPTIGKKNATKVLEIA